MDGAALLCPSELSISRTHQWTPVVYTLPQEDIIVMCRSLLAFPFLALHSPLGKPPVTNIGGPPVTKTGKPPVTKLGEPPVTNIPSV